MPKSFGTVLGNTQPPKSAERIPVPMPVVPFPTENLSAPIPIRRTARRVAKTEEGRFRLVDYTPVNILYYDAAYAGYVAGAFVGKSPTSVNTDTYDSIVAQAIVFAVQVDETIPFNSTADTAQAALVSQLSQAVNDNRYTTGLPASAFEGAANGIATLLSTSIANGLVPVPSDGGGGSSYSQDCTAGGTITYAGPTPIPPKVILTGTPASFFTFNFPSVDGSVTIDNQTGQYANFSGGVTVVGVLLVTLTAGNATAPWNPPPGTPSDIITTGAALSFGSFPTVAGIGLVNVEANHALVSCGIYTLLQQYDALLYAGELPSGGSGPQSPAAGQKWYQSPATTTAPVFGVGGLEFTESGVTEQTCPQAYYPGNVWTTQAQSRAIARTVDRITGTAQQVIHYIPLPDNSNGFASVFTIEVAVKAAVVGSGLCVLGDFATAILSISASSTAGSAVAGALTVIVSPTTASSTNFSDVLITASIVGDDLAISVTSSSTAGAADETDFQTRTTAEIC